MTTSPVAEAPVARPRTRRSSPRRRVTVLVLVTALLLGLAAVGGSYYYSSVLLVPNHSEPRYYDEVFAVNDRGGVRSVTLAENEGTLRPGVWDLRWTTEFSGSAQIGEILGRSDGKVERRLLGGATPPIGSRVRVNNDVWGAGNPRTAFGLDFSEVMVPTELGPAKAWYVGPPAGIEPDTWVIGVHGHNASYTETLRMIGPVHRAGMASLSVSYRNDRDAPGSADGLHHLGDSEWRDVESAMRMALGNGAKRFVLYGYSMGGAVVGQLLARSALASKVAAVVLDSPVVSWSKTLTFQAEQRGLPTFLVPIAKTISSWRAGLDFDRFDLAERPPTVKPETLLLHGDADRTVPVTAARELAWAAGRLNWPLRYTEVQGAGHVALWNHDRASYERTVTDFITNSVAAAGR
ncbi:alpha/beta hydrolase family protein [Allokutzneria multivorans]|uniref:alpha/beta hydrolase family protein n=1 Tax=Allokutzneria multivorans TaxID=1142134 RepID=UPI0031EF4BE3